MKSISAFWRGRVVGYQTGDTIIYGHVTGLSRNCLKEATVKAEFEDGSWREIYPDNLFFPV